MGYTMPIATCDRCGARRSLGEPHGACKPGTTIDMRRACAKAPDDRPADAQHAIADGNGRPPMATVRSIREGEHTRADLHGIIAEGSKEIDDMRQRIEAVKDTLKVGAYRGGRFAAPVDWRDCL